MKSQAPSCNPSCERCEGSGHVSHMQCRRVGVLISSGRMAGDVVLYVTSAVSHVDTVQGRRCQEVSLALGSR